MTQTLPSVAVPEQARRLLPIAADLLPVEVVDSRQVRKVRRSVLAGIIALVVVLTGWYGYAVYQTSVARVALSDAQAEVQRLQNKQGDYNPVIQAQSESAAIRAQLAGLLATDLPWSQLVKPALDAAPNGVAVNDVTGALADPSKKTGTVQLPNTSGHNLVGQVTVRGTAPDKAVVARYVDGLAKVRGLANPYVTSAAPHDGVVDFTVQFDITTEVLGGRFTTEKN